MSTSKVLITGGAGFIGYHLTKKLTSQGLEVIVYDSFKNYIPPQENNYRSCLRYRLQDLKTHATFVRGDIRDSSFFSTVLTNTRPDIVIHLASIPLAKAANQFPEEAIQVNVNGTTNVLEALRRSPSATRFVYISSSCVYGDFSYEPANEDHPVNPIDIYGATKLSGEVLTRAYGSRFGVEYAIVRPSAVYGATDCNQRVTQLIIEQAMQGKPVVLHNGGANRLDFTHVSDTVSGIALAALAPDAKNETFNITRGEGKSISELTAMVKERFPGLHVVEEPQDERRPMRGALAIDKARRLLGYAPQYDLHLGINEYIDFSVGNSAT